MTFFLQECNSLNFIQIPHFNTVLHFMAVRPKAGLAEKTMKLLFSVPS